MDMWSRTGFRTYVIGLGSSIAIGLPRTLLKFVSVVVCDTQDRYHETATFKDGQASTTSTTKLVYGRSWLWLRHGTGYAFG
ncbi:hypothetical protein A0H81_03143 [Grifola frondosa]|uniref:Uncharacterized protein n=1 Tax=Grifola frondosa TaxID=5627 RepID=A0A1C7MNK0_GRIFR|nr:hypothetical protein A0H81_03143 [Grifola frondosa]